MTQQYEALQSQFNALLKWVPPEEKVVPPTLFDIAGFPHYEQVVSNVYAFFFQTENPHGLGPLFLNALTNLIVRKGVEPPLFIQERCMCRREWATKRGNYIDLVLYDEMDEKGQVTNAFVIENKVYATITNDLEDYLGDVPLNPENKGQKLGVVLTLKPYQLKSRYASRFVNITHAELMGSVQETIGSRLLTASDRYLPLFRDFISNLLSLHNPTHMDEQVKFYFDHAARIKQLLELHKKVESQICKAVQQQIEAIGFQTTRNNIGLILRYENDPEAQTYLALGDLLEKQTVDFSLWSKVGKTVAWNRLSDTSVLGQDKHESIQIQSQTPKKAYWGDVARAKLVIEPHGYLGIEQAPRRIAHYLENHWLPFLRHFNQTLAASGTYETGPAH